MALHLTFDDGPSPVWTPAVLDALARVGATATFFVLGSAVLEHRSVVRRTLDAGHRVELHGHRHRRHDRLSATELGRDTDAALAALADLGARPTWWRTPWGHVTEDSRAAALQRGLAIVGWDADTHDWRGDRAEDMLAAVVREAPDGGIVLAHDALGPGATRPGCDETARFVGLAAAWASERGLAMTALPDASPADHAVPLAVRT